MPLNPQNFLAPSARFPLRKHRFVNTRASSAEHGGAEGNTRSEIDMLVRNYQKPKLLPWVDYPVKSEPTTLKTR